MAEVYIWEMESGSDVNELMMSENGSDRVDERADAPLTGAPRCQGTRQGHRAALQAAWRARPDQLPHHQPKIESANLDQQAFQDVRRPTQMYPSHPPVVQVVRERPLQQLAPLA